MSDPRQRDRTAGLREGVPPAQASRLIDRTVASELRATVGADLHRQLVRQFIEETDSELHRMTKDAPLGNAAAEILHKISGSAAVFGAVPLRRLIAETEDALRGGDDARAERLLEAVGACWEETRSALERSSASSGI